MNISSYFIENIALFGSFPSQDQVEELEKNGVKYFINLTYDTENKITKYHTKSEYIHYPIEDHKAPKNWRSFAKLVLYLSRVIEEIQMNGKVCDDKLFIHCKAGCGRSGVLVASLLCHLKKMMPEESINYTTMCYRNRLLMNEKLRMMNSPNTYAQRTFVYKFFHPIYFYKAYKSGYTTGFSNFSLHKVEVPNIGVFPTSEAAFQAHKNLHDLVYIKKLEESRTPTIAKRLGKIFENPNNSDVIMEHILDLKVKQHECVRENLLNTGLRPIIDNNKNDEYFGVGKENTGKNIQGLLLVKIRNREYETLYEN